MRMGVGNTYYLWNHDDIRQTTSNPDSFRMKLSEHTWYMTASNLSVVLTNASPLLRYYINYTSSLLLGGGRGGGPRFSSLFAADIIASILAPLFTNVSRHLEHITCTRVEMAEDLRSRFCQAAAMLVPDSPDIPIIPEELMENDRIVHFLQWFCDNIHSTNILTADELARWFINATHINRYETIIFCRCQDVKSSRKLVKVFWTCFVSDTRWYMCWSYVPSHKSILFICICAVPYRYPGKLLLRPYAYGYPCVYRYGWPYAILGSSQKGIPMVEWIASMGLGHTSHMLTNHTYMYIYSRSSGLCH